MWSLDRPEHGSRASYTSCISRVKNLSLRRRLREAVDQVAAAEDVYTQSASTASLYALREEDFEVDGVSRAEMIWLYTNGMSRRASPGRPIYDSLLAAPELGRCPLCGHRDVSTLDHHLPKSAFPALAVTPLNLVPACTECNHAKRSTVWRTSEEEALHPYFDDLDCDQWLFARVLKTSPASLKFFADPPGHWRSNLRRRTRLHFKRFRLARLYATQAAGEINGIRYELTQLFVREGGKEGDGPSAVKNASEGCRRQQISLSSK